MTVGTALATGRSSSDPLKTATEETHKENQLLDSFKTLLAWAAGRGWTMGKPQPLSKVTLNNDKSLAGSEQKSGDRPGSQSAFWPSPPTILCIAHTYT